MKKNGQYILMLEDDIDDRFTTQSFFDEQGYDIGLRFLTQSDEVIPFLENCCKLTETLPGLIILDKNVPASGGVDVLRKIRSHKRYSHIPVVIVSGSAYPAEVEESYRLGASSYICKPFSDELTRKKIDACVRYWFEIVELPQLV